MYLVVHISNSVLVCPYTRAQTNTGTHTQMYLVAHRCNSVLVCPCMPMQVHAHKHVSVCAVIILCCGFLCGHTHMHARARTHTHTHVLMVVQRCKSVSVCTCITMKIHMHTHVSGCAEIILCCISMCCTHMQYYEKIQLPCHCLVVDAMFIPSSACFMIHRVKPL